MANMDSSAHITVLEVTLYVWFASFTYDELGGFIDAGSIFYAVDIWNGCDIIIILIGAAFAITREWLNIDTELHLLNTEQGLLGSIKTALGSQILLSTSCPWKHCSWSQEFARF